MADKACRIFCYVCSLVTLPLPVWAQELAAGTTLEIRLSAATGSRISQRGSSIQATIIAPVSVHGEILVPQGSTLLGSVADVIAIGLGLKHSTASLTYVFHTLHLLDGAEFPVNTQSVEVETAKEDVDALGTARGIHPVVSLSSSLAFYTVPLLLVDPAIGAPMWFVKSLVAPPANPEIYFPTGTELIVRLTAAVSLAGQNMSSSFPAESFSPEDLTQIQQVLKNSAPRAYMGRRPSDVANLLLIGSPSQMDRAFQASGWVQAQRKSPLTLYRMYHALTKRHGYPRAPMNALTLNGVPSAFVYEKSLDTVQKRHHVRLWRDPHKENIWLGAAAEDIGFRFKLTHWTHSTDPDIDSERAKVVNDLAFTGCLSAAGLLRRGSANIVQDATVEHSILTDGNVAVIRLNDCINPRLMAGVNEISASHQRRRLARTLTGFRDDLIRSNIVFTVYNTLGLLARRKTEPAFTRIPVINREPRRLDWLTPVAPLESRLQQ